MSYNAWLGEGREPWLATWIAFALLPPAAAAVLWRLGRSTASFATLIAVVYFVFLFSKQAFVNYYSFIVGVLEIAIARRLPTATEAMRTEPHQGQIA